MGRKLLILGLLALLMAPEAWGVPARPGKMPYTQPDGSVIWVMLNGDEHFSWYSDLQGNPLGKDEDGYLRPTTLEQLHSAEAVRGSSDGDVMDAGRWSSYDDPYPTNFGDRKILAILMNFSDIQFTLNNPRDQFSRMLNQQGYSDNGAHGSVRDYYVENSHNQYRPSFDVYGPVTVSKTESYYVGGAKYRYFTEAVLEALDILAAQGVDFSQYDTDGDGDLDMVLIYFAGYNQAEWAEDTIWPHQRTGTMGSINGLTLNRYFCTSEYKGNTGTDMCGIGTTCHEFAHALGLPDMYDTNYDTSGYNSHTTDYFDLMASGNYNDNGRRPPYLSALERNMLGWMPSFTPLSGSGEYELEPVSENKAYMCSTVTEGEYFIFEYRRNAGWDAGCNDWRTGSDNGGLLAYHVDRSNRLIAGTTTSADLWELNDVNAVGGHPCYYTLESSSGCYYFPGKTDALVTTLTPVDWEGNNVGITLSGIACDGAKASFTVSSLENRVLRGTVIQASDGQPVEGAQVVLSKAAYSFNAAPGRLSTDLVAITSASGEYSFDLAGNSQREFILSVSKGSFYNPQARNVTFALSEASPLVQNFALAGHDSSMASFGYGTISVAADVPVAVPQAGKTVRSTVWTVDGMQMESPTAQSALAPGEHTYQAVITYFDGTSETLYLFYTAQ